LLIKKITHSLTITYFLGFIKTYAPMKVVVCILFHEKTTYVRKEKVKTILYQVGFNGGDGFNYFALNQSRTNAIIGLASLTNVDLPGKFVFRIDTAVIEHGGCNTEGKT